MIPINVYDNMNNLKFDNVNFEYGFKLYICMNPKLLQMWQSKQSPYSCFQPSYKYIWAKWESLHLNIETLFWRDFKKIIYFGSQ
jgi:hypothetical protein